MKLTANERAGNFTPSSSGFYEKNKNDVTMTSHVEKNRVFYLKMVFLTAFRYLWTDLDEINGK